MVLKVGHRPKDEEEKVRAVMIEEDEFEKGDECIVGACMFWK